MYSNAKVIAMDLDGTLTQHKTPLSAEHRAVLTELSKKYKLLMVGAGQVMRIFNQLEKFPIDIIGNYGMQYGKYNSETGEIDIVKDIVADLYCKENGLSHDEVVYIGDDYGLGGNDESVYKSDFKYITIDNYLDFPKIIKSLL